ncbi:MAG: FAD binding domain-containing protein [Solirubrobacteraceae bacterium]
MKPFTYLRPTSAAEAAGALGEHNGDARMIAGGQSLLLAMKDRLERPSVLVSLQDVPEVRGVSYSDSGTLTIGAATTYWQLESSALNGGHGLLPRVAGDVADVPVRRMGTVGGALCHADPVFDFPVAALAGDAELELASAAGTRRVPVSEFQRGPYLTGREPGEVLTKIRFPAADPSARFAFVKHRLRRFDSALVSVACLLSLDGGKVASARIACGAVGPVPLRLSAAEELIVGQEPSAELFHEAGAKAADGVELGTNNPVIAQEYKRDVLPTIVARALSAAVNGKE